MDEQSQDDQLEPTYNSSVLIRDIGWKTYREPWTIEKGGGRGSGRSVLMELHDDDLLTEVVQSNKYYKSRTIDVTSEVGLTTDRDFSVTPGG